MTSTEDLGSNSFPDVTNEVAIKLELESRALVMIAKLVAGHDQLRHHIRKAELAH